MLESASQHQRNQTSNVLRLKGGNFSGLAPKTARQITE